MTVRDVLNTVLPALKMSQAEFGRKIGWYPQQISQKVVRGSLRADELLEMLELSGVEVLFKIKETGEILTMQISGHGHRLKGMSDGVIYDTAASSALSNTFYADGLHEYDENGEAQELYIDRQGRYFIAEYNLNQSQKERVRSVPAGVAAAFIEKYGTAIEKQHD